MRAVVVAVLVAGTAGPLAGQDCLGVDFVELAADVGIDFVHDRGGDGAKHLPETMGSGLAWSDLDGDGWLDLYLVQSGPYPPTRPRTSENRWYRNVDGERFERLVSTGAEDGGYGQGVVAVDANGDGAPDLYVANDGSDRWFLNQGDGTFRDATNAVGLGLDGWSSAAAFGDADGDGDLDLYVVRYLQYDPSHDVYCDDPETRTPRFCDPSLFLGDADRYYSNDRSGGFRDVTSEAGLASADGRGLGVLFADFDGDRHPDLYVSNDLTLNLLYRNNGEGGFEDLSLLSGAAVNTEGKPEAGMGLALGDVDRDGDPDVAVTNFDVETNTLYRNLGGMFFQDVASSSGLAASSFNLLGFGVVMADVDLDGHLDVVVGNGHVFERPRRDGVTWAQPDVLLAGNGTGFGEVRCEALATPSTVTRGVASADFDNDGDVDLGRQTSGGPFSLLENRVEAAEWIGVRVVGSDWNREAIGAEVSLRSAAGRQVRWVVAGDSYQSSSDRRALFGVPGGDAERLEVVWPSGRRTVVVSPPTGRYLTIRLSSEAGEMGEVTGVVGASGVELGGGSGTPIP